MSDPKKPAGGTPVQGVVYDISAARRRAAARAAARELSHALLAVEDSPEMRAEKVRALRAQIANGTYRPDPRDVARHMLERGF